MGTPIYDVGGHILVIETYNWACDELDQVHADRRRYDPAFYKFCTS